MYAHVLVMGSFGTSSFRNYLETDDNIKEGIMTKSSKKIRKSNIKTTIIVMILGAIILFYFNYLNNKVGKKDTTSLDEIEKMTEYDMENEYPKTPRDVAKLHSRYTKLFYGKSEISDKNLKKLVEMVRKIYCNEMNIMNTEEAHYNSLKADIKEYNERKVYVATYQLPEASQVKYFTKDGIEYATLEVEFTIVTEKERGYYYQSYVLIKEDDKWKIYGWSDNKAE